MITQYTRKYIADNTILPTLSLLACKRDGPPPPPPDYTPHFSHPPLAIEYPGFTELGPGIANESEGLISDHGGAPLVEKPKFQCPLCPKRI